MLCARMRARKPVHVSPMALLPQVCLSNVASAAHESNAISVDLTVTSTRGVCRLRSTL